MPQQVDSERPLTFLDFVTAPALLAHGRAAYVPFCDKEGESLLANHRNELFRLWGRLGAYVVSHPKHSNERNISWSYLTWDGVPFLVSAQADHHFAGFSGCDEDSVSISYVLEGQQHSYLEAVRALAGPDAEPQKLPVVSLQDAIPEAFREVQICGLNDDEILDEATRELSTPHLPHRWVSGGFCSCHPPSYWYMKDVEGCELLLERIPGDQRDYRASIAQRRDHFLRLRDELDIQNAEVRFKAAKEEYDVARSELLSLLAAFGGKLDE